MREWDGAQVGPTVEDLASALGEIPRHDRRPNQPGQKSPAMTPATSTTTLRRATPLLLSSYLMTGIPGGVSGGHAAANERLLVWIFEVDGQRGCHRRRRDPDSPRRAKDKLRDILDTIVFDGPTKPIEPSSP